MMDNKIGQMCLFVDIVRMTPARVFFYALGVALAQTTGLPVVLGQIPGNF